MGGVRHFRIAGFKVWGFGLGVLFGKGMDDVIGDVQVLALVFHCLICIGVFVG